jgi:hypothetical protein
MRLSDVPSTSVQAYAFFHTGIDLLASVEELKGFSCNINLFFPLNKNIELEVLFNEVVQRDWKPY